VVDLTNPLKLAENKEEKDVAKTDNLFYYYQEAETGKTFLFKVRGVTHYRQGEFSIIIEASAP